MNKTQYRRQAFSKHLKRLPLKRRNWTLKQPGRPNALHLSVHFGTARNPPAPEPPPLSTQRPPPRPAPRSAQVAPALTQFQSRPPERPRTPRLPPSELAKLSHRRARTVPQPPPHQSQTRILPGSAPLPFLQPGPPKFQLDSAPASDVRRTPAGGCTDWLLQRSWRKRPRGGGEKVTLA